MPPLNLDYRYYIYSKSTIAWEQLDQIQFTQNDRLASQAKAVILLIVIVVMHIFNTDIVAI